MRYGQSGCLGDQNGRGQERCHIYAPIHSHLDATFFSRATLHLLDFDSLHCSTLHSPAMVGRTLGHLVCEVPSTNPDSIADSCGEESSDEEIQPKPLSEVKNGNTASSSSSRFATPSSIRKGSGGGGENNVRVENTIGRGGKVLYQTTRLDATTTYYSVQW